VQVVVWCHRATTDGRPRACALAAVLLPASGVRRTPRGTIIFSRPSRTFHSFSEGNWNARRNPFRGLILWRMRSEKNAGNQEARTGISCLPQRPLEEAWARERVPETTPIVGGT
jgi:hypothetical protein